MHRHTRLNVTGKQSHRVESSSNMNCINILYSPREDGSAAHTVGMALVFTEPVSELDAGLYICHVSYHHITAAVSIRVDVTSEDTQHSEYSSYQTFKVYRSEWKK